MSFGLIGGILGGLAGGIIGGLASEGAYSTLADWFFGGSSGQSANDLLKPVLDVMRGYVREHIKHSGKKFHVHQVLATHMSSIHTDPSQRGLIARQMVNTPSVEQRDIKVCNSRYIPSSPFSY
jgi:hypothetical protein